MCRFSFKVSFCADFVHCFFPSLESVFLEDYVDTCEPCRYSEEGELEPRNSLCSISIGSVDLPGDFLNTLGPMFSALEEICEK